MGRVGSTILYVEDEEIDRLFMRRAFEQEGAELSLQMVKDGQAAIDYLSGSGAYSDRQAHPVPAAVLLDLNLPEVHGFDVLKWIREHPVHRQLPVVVFSSSMRQEDQDRARMLGADDFLNKPNSGVRFIEVVRQLNDRRLRAKAQTQD